MTSQRSAVFSKGAPAPPPFLSQAIVMGDFLFCSGQVGVQAATGKLVEGSIEARTRQILLNLQSVLTAGGSSLAKVVKCNIYLTDMKDFPAVNKIYAEFFEQPMPARTCVCVKELPMGTDVEIECVAGLKPGSSSTKL